MNPYVTFKPDDKRLKFKPGTTILEIAKQGRVYIKHKCGGKGSCLTCKVEVIGLEHVSKPNLIEERKLGSTLLEQGNRLACQTKVFDEVIVEIPEDPLKKAIRKQLESIE